MRWISLPDELTPAYLLDLGDVSPRLQDRLEHLLTALTAGAPDDGLRVADQIYAAAEGRHDRYGGALALIYRAEICRRQQRWEDALDAIRRALYWLELRVSPIARYNEAVAVYLEGVLHWTLRAEEKALQTFSHAQDTLAKSERYWGFEQQAARVGDCRNLTRWMTQILEATTVEQEDNGIGLLPVYEVAARTVIRTGAVVLSPHQGMIPAEVAARYLTPDHLLLQLDTLPVLCLRPGGQYIAVRIPEDATGLGWGRAGDLLVVEVTKSSVAAQSNARREFVLTSDQPFSRRSDGRVEFRSSLQRAESGVSFSDRNLVGIPRMLIREGDKV